MNAPTLRTVLQVDPHKTNKRIVWARLVTIESNGARHILSPWTDCTPAQAKAMAKREGVEIEESSL